MRGLLGKCNSSHSKLSQNLECFNFLNIFTQQLCISCKSLTKQFPLLSSGLHLIPLWPPHCWFWSKSQFGFWWVLPTMIDYSLCFNPFTSWFLTSLEFWLKTGLPSVHTASKNLWPFSPFLLFKSKPLSLALLIQIFCLYCHAIFLNYLTKNNLFLPFPVTSHFKYNLFYFLKLLSYTASFSFF